MELKLRRRYRSVRGGCVRCPCAAERHGLGGVQIARVAEAVHSDGDRQGQSGSAGKDHDDQGGLASAGAGKRDERGDGEEHAEQAEHQAAPQDQQGGHEFHQEGEDARIG